MCGIGGIVWQGNEDRMQITSEAVVSMKHRGPDEGAFYIDEFVGLVHARLSIVDNAGGKQPFYVPNHDQILIYNGEIYNYDYLKNILTVRGVNLKSHSDTELLFHLLLHFGKEILPSINGQFAFCYYNPLEQSILLARDAFGEKPLFYMKKNGHLAFASEVKTLIKLVSFEPKICSKQLNSLQRYWACLPDQSIFQEISQIPAGHSLEYKNGSSKLSCFIAPLRHISEEKSEKIDLLIKNSVLRRLRSDVPVGLMLSGGLDSSIIGQEMLENNSFETFKTFSVVFPDNQFDERKYQEIMVKHLGSDHYQVEIDQLAMCNNFEDAVYASESPSHRTAFIAIYALHQLVKKQGIKVLLSGEGADEMFMGYDIFKEVFIKDQIRSGKKFEDLKNHISSVNSFMPNDENYHRLIRLKYSNYRALSEYNKWNSSHSQRQQLSARSLSFSIQNNCESVVVDEEWYSFLKSKYSTFQNESELRRAQKIETETLMTGHLLCTQGDRVSMANSVETRLPFIDPSIAAFSMALSTQKDFFSSKSEKAILKNIYKKRLPNKILERKKFPFRSPDSFNFLSSNTGQEFVASYLDNVDELEGIFDVNKFNDFFKSCFKNGANPPRDNFAFVFGLTTMVLQKVLKRFSSKQNILMSKQFFEQSYKTNFGKILCVKNWLE